MNQNSAVARQPQRRLAVARPVQPGQRRPQVVVLGLQPVEPAELLRPAELRLRLLGQREEEGGVGAPEGLGFSARRRAAPARTRGPSPASR